jgi:hypothetical protein
MENSQSYFGVANIIFFSLPKVPKRIVAQHPFHYGDTWNVMTSTIGMQIPLRKENKDKGMEQTELALC